MGLGLGLGLANPNPNPHPHPNPNPNPNPNPKQAVMLYAPWCSRSKRLAAEWTALAKRYQRDKGLVVAKLDARRRVHKRVRV